MSPSEDEELVMLSGRVPARLKRLVDMDDRNNQEVLAAALWREVGDRERASLQRRAEEKRKEIAELESQRNEREREMSEKREELDRIQTMLENYEPRGVSEIDSLIDDAVKHDMAIPTESDRVERIATEHFDGDTEACVEAIQERTADREDVTREVVR